MTFINLSEVFDRHQIDRSRPAVCLVSGGVDSMVLLHLLVEEELYSPDQLSVLHFNHGLRGEESNKDELFVREVARKKGLACEVVRLSLAKGASIQNRARALRRQKLIELSIQKGWTVALSAHHADDQVETVLMNWLRGAGLRGLRGMSILSKLREELLLFRPLLSLRRSQIASYAREVSIPFREDSSNTTDDYWRNVLRHHLLPVLEKDSSGFVDFMRDFSALADGEYKSHLQQLEEFFKTFSDTSSMPLAAYRALNANVRFLVVEKSLKQAGFSKQVTQKHFAEIEKLLTQNSGERFYDQVHFRFDDLGFSFLPKTDCQSMEPLVISKTGTYFFPSLKCNIEVMEGKFETPQPHVLYLKKESFLFPFTIRGMLPGDRFTPLGAPGSKKISDFFIDRKVPRFQRSQIPILSHADGSVVGVMGFGPDEAFRAKKTGDLCVMVRIV